VCAHTEKGICLSHTKLWFVPLRNLVLNNSCARGGTSFCWSSVCVLNGTGGLYFGWRRLNIHLLFTPLFWHYFAGRQFPNAEAPHSLRALLIYPTKKRINPDTLARTQARMHSCTHTRIHIIYTLLIKGLRRFHCWCLCTLSSSIPAYIARASSLK